MDGGLDLKYSQHFGWHVEALVRDELERKYFGEQPVGNAIIVETDNLEIPYLISTPTMRVPSNVSKTVNAYLAFKGVLQAVYAFNTTAEKPISTLLCPGLGTGEGRMTADDCAKQMWRAYEVCVLKKFLTKGGLANAVQDHIALKG